MILTNKGEYIKDITSDEMVREIVERSRIGLVAALADRIDMSKDYTLSFKEDRYERVADNGELIHGVKMAVVAEPLVRCKDCKWCLVDEGGCERIGMVLFADEIENHFCGYGERKE